MGYFIFFRCYSFEYNNDTKLLYSDKNITPKNACLKKFKISNISRPLMSDSDSNRSDSALDQEFLFYLSLADKLVCHKDLKQCQKWFEKLCSKLYTSCEAKKRRNNYLIRLLIALHRNRLETPFDHSPSAGVSSSLEEVLPEAMPETEGADVFSDRTDSTYTVSKPLFIQGDVCGSSDVSAKKERITELEDSAFQSLKVESSASESRILSDRSAEISERSAESTKTRVKIRRKVTRKRSKSVPSKLLFDTSKKLRGGTSDLTAAQEYFASSECRAKNLVPNFFEYALPTYFDEPRLAVQRERHFKNELEYECSGRKVGDADQTTVLDEQAPDEVEKTLFLSRSTTNKSACETNNGDFQSMTLLKLPENLKIVSNKRVFHELGDQFPHPPGVSDQGESSCDKGTDLTRLLKTVGVCDGLFLSAPDQTGDIQKSTDFETQLTSNHLDETNSQKKDLLYDERREELAGVSKALFEPIRNLAGGYDGPFVVGEDTLFAENWSSKNRAENIGKPSVRGGILKNGFMRQPSTTTEEILTELTHSPVTEHLRSKRDSIVSDHHAKKSQAESAGNIFNDLYQMYPKSVVDKLLRLWNIERLRVIADFKKMHQQRIGKMERAAKLELEEKVRSIKNGKETLVKLWECKERIDRFMKAPRFPSGGEEQQKQLMEALRVEIAEERAKLKTESDLNTQLKVGLAKATLEKEEQDANFTAMRDELRNLAEQLWDVLAAICDEYETQHIALNKNILGWLDSKPEVSNT